VKQGSLTVTKEDSVMTDPTKQIFDDDGYPVTSLDARNDQPLAVPLPGTRVLMPGGVHNTGEHRGRGRPAVEEGKRARRGGRLARSSGCRGSVSGSGDRSRGAVCVGPGDVREPHGRGAVGRCPARRPGPRGMAGADQAVRVTLGRGIRGSVDRGAPDSAGLDEGVESRTAADLHRANFGPCRCRVLGAGGGAALAPPAGGATGCGCRSPPGRARSEGSAGEFGVCAGWWGPAGAGLPAASVGDDHGGR
jgi:hypothetical protein